jgi:Transcriptional regulator
MKAQKRKRFTYFYVNCYNDLIQYMRRHIKGEPVMANAEIKAQTKYRLLEALLHLLNSKDLIDISVSELVRKAGVSRSAFYRNYNYIDEILIEYANNIFHGFFQSKITNASPVNWQQTSLLICRIIRENKFFVWQLCINGKSEIWFNASVSEGEPFYENKLGRRVPEEKLIFLTGGIMALVLGWLDKGNKQSINDIANIINPQIKIILDDKKTFA